MALGRDAGGLHGEILSAVVREVIRDKSWWHGLLAAGGLRNGHRNSRRQSAIAYTKHALHRDPDCQCWLTAWESTI